MRTCLSLILVGLLASCPIVCGTAESTFGLKVCDHVSSGDHDNPASHPVNDDCCVCNGALKVDNPGHRVAGLDLDGPPLSFWVVALPPLAPLPPTPSTGLMPGLAGSERSARVCALLQVFRC